MRKVLVIAGSVVVVVVIVAALFLAGVLPNPFGKEGGGEEKATVEEAAAELEGASVELALVEKMNYLAGQVERYSSPTSSGTTVDYYYDPAAGRIVRRDDFSPVQGEVSVSLEQARAAAEDFAREQVPFFGRADLALTSSLDAAANTSAPGVFIFTWTATDPVSGALLPTFLEVEVDGSTGAVRSFNSVDLAVTVSTQPQVDEQAAIAAAQEALGGTLTGAEATAALMVGTDPPGNPAGKQALVWVVSIGTASPDDIVEGAQVFVDAQTGTVLSVDPFL